jgi:hypothetical protein
MADVVIFAIVIASAVSLLIVSPHEAQRRILGALRDYGETEALLPEAVAATLCETTTRCGSSDSRRTDEQTGSARPSLQNL